MLRSISSLPNSQRLLLLAYSLQAISVLLYSWGSLAATLEKSEELPYQPVREPGGPVNPKSATEARTNARTYFDL